MNRTFIEAPSFSAKWQSLGLTDDDLSILQGMLLKDPKSGSVISGTGGIRKIRIPIDSIGKRSGGMKMDVYESLERSLLEAIAIKNEEVPLKKREGMPAETYYVADSERTLIDEIVRLRKEQNISQVSLARMTGCQQQTISRFEQQKNSPSLRFLLSILHALGYELQIVKR